MSGQQAAGARRPSRISSLAGLLTRRRRLVVAAWLVAVAVLAVAGRNLGQELQLQVIYAEGSQSKLAHEIATRGFGNEYAMIVMLRGPERAMEQQGRTLARRLRREGGMLVVSPWSAAAGVEGLRPRPGIAALVVRAEGDAEMEVTDLLPPVERQVERTVRSPVRASIAGFPAIVDSLLDVNDRATKVAELIALPVLLVVLLLVFRSIIAALVPVVLGGAVVAASQGILTVLLNIVELDLFSLAVVGMMGLALGVDYSLLVVSRFREERKQADPALAARLTVQAASRSILPAGCGLLLAMGVAALVLQGQVAISVAVAVSVATLLSMLSALCVAPALLALLGDNLDRWSLPALRRPQASRPQWSRGIAGRPRAVASIVVLMLALAGWAFTLDSGSASVGFLPAGDPGRLQQEDVERGLGPGWIAPIEVVVDGGGSPVTSPRRLRALSAFQRRVERDPGVSDVAGFDRIAKGARRLRGIEASLAEQRRGLERLSSGIFRLQQGARLNTGGLLQAADGAGALEAGIGAAGSGSELLAKTLLEAGSGTRRLSEGLGRAGAGSEGLAEGANQASSGATRLADGLERTREGAAEIGGTARLLENAMRSGQARLAELDGPLRSTEEQLGIARQALQQMTSGKSDPEYAAALLAVEEASRSFGGSGSEDGEPPEPSALGVERGIERAEGQFETGLYLSEQLSENSGRALDGIEKLARGSARLDRGLRRLAAGSGRLAAGLAQLERGGESLPAGLTRLQQGAERLAGGLARIGEGSGQLADGLSGGAEKSKTLVSVLRRIGAGLERQEDGAGGTALDRLQEQSPGLFRSGHFALAGLDGSPPARRKQLGFLVSLDQGGSYARMLVIPRDDPPSDRLLATKSRLERGAVELAGETDAEVAVGGIAPATIDADEALRNQSLVLRLALSLVSFLVLVPVLRSLLLPLLAALINLITVSAVFGLLSLLFNSSLLGGPGHVDSTIIPASMIVLFGLAIDYEVFVFARIREEYVRTGSTRAAIETGLGRTAHVVTGAAMIMIAVFLAFSISALMPVRNFGVALAIGVFLDAFVVRLVVIPALMEKLGRWNWWLPRWLDRLLPGGAQHAQRLAGTVPA